VTQNISFTPEHKQLSSIFGENTRYVIPSYQRAYSWESTGKSDKNNQLNNLWDDLVDFFDANKDKTDEYFIGSMVAISKNDNNERYFEVVDGQQRITTLLLLFGAMKCFLVKQKGVDDGKSKDFLDFLEGAIKEFEILIYNKKVKGISFIPELKLKINRDYGYDFNEYFKNLIDCKDGKTQKDLLAENEKIINRYKVNYQFFFQKIEEMFLDKGCFTEDKAQLFSQFAQFLRIRVAMIVITTPSFNSAYFIFEVLNNRGLPLSNKDLTRNLVISEFIKAGFSEVDAAQKWYELEENYLFPQDFIGRWVESKKAAQQQFSAFNDLEKLYKENYKDTLSQKAIEIFYEDFKTDLYYFDFFEDTSKIEDKCLAYKIEFLKKTNNLRYTTNFILAAMRYFKFNGQTNDAFYDLLNIYEIFILYTLLTPYKRFSSIKVYEAIKELNQTNLSVANSVLKLENSDEQGLKNLISGKLTDNYLGKLLISKYFWIRECNEDDVVEVLLDFDKATLEHIFPQTPTGETNWADRKKFPKSFVDDFTYKIGNMTLLTHKVNATIKNGDFKLKKQPEYQKTKLNLTVELGNLPDIDITYLYARQEQIVNTLYSYYF
jgi:uncharacterized protein with ParB-like and HNH nuclease domain